MLDVIFEGLWFISSNNQNYNQKRIKMLPNTNMQETRTTLLPVQGLQRNMSRHVQLWRIWKTCKKCIICGKYWPCFHSGSKNAKRFFRIFYFPGESMWLNIKKKSLSNAISLVSSGAFFFLALLYLRIIFALFKSKKENFGKV